MNYLNYFNTSTLALVALIAFFITILAFICKLIERDSKNATYFFVSSIFVLMTVCFIGVLAITLPNTEKTISSIKCYDYETASENIDIYVPGRDIDKIFQTEIIEDSKSETTYLEVRVTSVVLQCLPVFEVRKETRYILHMPQKKEKTLRGKAFY